MIVCAQAVSGAYLKLLHAVAAGDSHQGAGGVDKGFVTQVGCSDGVSPRCAWSRNEWFLRWWIPILCSQTRESIRNLESIRKTIYVYVYTP
jgi:hypothetical protein